MNPALLPHSCHKTLDSEKRACNCRGRMPETNVEQKKSSLTWNVALTSADGHFEKAISQFSLEYSYPTVYTYHYQLLFILKSKKPCTCRNACSTSSHFHIERPRLDWFLPVINALDPNHLTSLKYTPSSISKPQNLEVSLVRVSSHFKILLPCVLFFFFKKKTNGSNDYFCNKS